MKRLLPFALLALAACVSGRPGQPSLKQELLEIADAAPGTVGIAFVSESDTVTVNNSVRFPMMSVMKLHEALAVSDRLGGRDTVLTITEADIDRNTWSPMLKEYEETPFTISTDKLIRYAISESDNNASNILFDRIVSPAETEVFIKSIAPDTTFTVLYSEAGMKRDNELSYCNTTTPLSAALLIGRVMTQPGNETVKAALTGTVTGTDRLATAIEPGDSVVLAHKTGSGYRNAAGELIAHNDVGYFSFPDGRGYSLAVFVRDFRGTEDEASEIIARISKTIYKYYNYNK